MQVRQLRIWLGITGVSLYSSAVLVLVWAFVWPCRPGNGPAGKMVSQVAEDESKPAQHTAQELNFESLWATRLRAPLVDAPWVAGNQGVVQQDAATPEIRLVGTILEPGRSLALFSTPRTAVEIRAVGELVGESPGGAEVLEIERERVVVRYQGKLLTLTLPGAEGS